MCSPCMFYLMGTTHLGNNVITVYVLSQQQSDTLHASELVCVVSRDEPLLWARRPTLMYISLLMHLSLHSVLFIAN